MHLIARVLIVVMSFAGCQCSTTPEPTPRPTINISAQPEVLEQGKKATLQWTSSNANEVEISGIGRVEERGSREVSPQETTTYIATARGRGGEATASIRVAVTEAQKPELLPDLKITDIKVEPVPVVVENLSVLVRGTSYAFRFEVANEGKGPVAGNIAVSVDYGCSGPGIGATGNIVVTGRGLGPGERAFTGPFTINIPVDRAPGSCNFKFKVDPDNIWKESDERESSNVWTTSVRVH
jgi:hypothetical protein